LLHPIAVFAVAWFGSYLPGVIACLLTMVGIQPPLDCWSGFPAPWARWLNRKSAEERCCATGPDLTRKNRGKVPTDIAR